MWSLLKYGVKPQIKSDAKSIKFGEQANNLFEEKRYLDSMIFYNKAISYAKSKNVLAVSYSNRSNLFLELGLYEESLKNIKWARENEYPGEMTKLSEREKKCKILTAVKTEVTENPQDFFKLSYTANKKVPWIVDCVEIRKTEKYGRGIYAKRDLKAGDIISIEKPVVSFLCSDVRFRRCYNCFKIANMNLIPCEDIACIMFCTVECRDSLNSKAIYGIESVLSDDVKLLSEMIYLAGGRNKFAQLMNSLNLNNLNMTILDFDFSDPDDPNYNENVLKCLLSLKAETNFKINKRWPKVQKYLTPESANHILNIMHVNSVRSSFIGNGFADVPDGTTISLFSSFINHSCIANSNSIYYDDKIITFIKRPVKAGEQIFTNLAGLYEVRYDLKQLETLLAFKCECKACRGEVILPKLKDLYTQSCVNQWLLETDYENLNSATVIFQNICNNINQNIVPTDMRYVLGLDMILNRIATRSSLPCVP